MKPPFGRGINIGNALEAPKEGEWGVVIKEEYFDVIKTAGFDSVRTPVAWWAHAEESPPYQIDPKFFQRVDSVINQAFNRHLVIIVNMHHYGALSQDPEKHRERFLALWQQIAEHYRGYRPELALELLNEPQGNLTAAKWNSLLKEAIGVVRATNPKRDLLVGPANWNGLDELPNLELPEDDRHLIVTFHYYSPYHFTHQGVPSLGEKGKQWEGTKWTGTDAERQAITDDLDKAVTWSVKHRRPLFLGEFGTFNKADMESRARWTKFMADEALKRKIGFAYWEFCSGFGAYDPDKNEWIEPIKQALLDIMVPDKSGGK